ncbi:hypothetical protein AQ914_04580 [Burkholderia pseudomallei]|uniref:hypothetical protein n=1 Tax=Burkholderia pseudomallei TaxID=28450 RepID=UPI000976C2F0|nr:hypothetical protein [Burkholderia pseudomallei]ONC26361.1 hypothetical protein AQ914_04580 [Burkholderia pseudomallei]
MTIFAAAANAATQTINADQDPSISTLEARLKAANASESGDSDWWKDVETAPWAKDDRTQLKTDVRNIATDVKDKDTGELKNEGDDINRTHSLEIEVVTESFEEEMFYTDPDDDASGCPQLDTDCDW